MTKEQVKWLYSKYSNKRVSIVEGVMGFYDGENRGCSTYSVTKILDVPTLLIIDGAGTYITVSAILKGVLEYRDDNTIKAVVLNNLSSKIHYQLIKKQIEKDHRDIEVIGWIKKGLKSLKSIHLGLNLDELDKIDNISSDVLENIDIKKLESIFRVDRYDVNIKYPFPKVGKVDKKISIVYDKNFSFLYHDNLEFLKETFREVEMVDSTKNEEISEDSDIVYICGGYVETDIAYNRVKESLKFKKSLINHSKEKRVYAECAGLLYLSNRVDNKEMSGILDIDFTLEKRFVRLGYYYNDNGIKGHAFHYTNPTIDSLERGFHRLKKYQDLEGEIGAWRSGLTFGTYLHTMFRNNFPKLEIFSELL
jgi:cobyrinic acid a,c-diamide synthase